MAATIAGGLFGRWPPMSDEQWLFLLVSDDDIAACLD